MIDPQSTLLSTQEVFPGATGPDEEYLEFPNDSPAVSYFVGRNGSGKSRAAKALASRLGGRYLSTDRLLGIMNTINYGWGMTPTEYKGPPIDESRNSISSNSRANGMATDLLLILREQPEVGLKVAAFMRKALGRVIEFRESAGFFDPYVRIGNAQYSLLRDEGHGLRELTILLAAVYVEDWSLLVVDEPELHLHPSLARLWLAELNRECQTRGIRSVIVTHEPALLRPADAADLDAVWLFRPGAPPTTVGSHIIPGTHARVTASLRFNPQLLSQLAFAPRPVLAEGPHDIAALTSAIVRLKEPAVVAQTEFVACGSSGAVALWFTLGRSLGLDLRAVADLDALFNSDVQATIDRSPQAKQLYRDDLLAEPPVTHVALRPLIEQANKENVAANEKERARWLADISDRESGLARRRDKLLEVWRVEGIWLHPQGNLEDVLQIEKGKANPADAAAVSGAIDEVVEWCSFDLDPLGDLLHLLGGAVERIANALTQAQGLDPGAVFDSPVGSTAESDRRLVDVTHQGADRYRITVKSPLAFRGYYAEVDRNTPPAMIRLIQPPLA